MALFLRALSARIRRRESPFYDRLYRIAKAVRGVSVPTLRPLHSLLYHEWRLRTSAWHYFWQRAYWEPMFKSQCVSVGKDFRMEFVKNGSAKVRGDLRVTFGDGVHIFDNTVFVGLKVLDAPELVVGDNTYLGPGVRILVGRRVQIGKHCMIVSRMITDNPSHPVDDIMERLAAGGGSPSPESIRPVTIGDFCFLPIETVVYPGANIGDGVVARIGTHIHGDVPPFCQVAGNPMRIVRKLPIPVDLKEVVGEERYERYLETREELSL